MVLGHTEITFACFFTLFNMPLFFILSGYFFKEHCYSNIAEIKIFINKRVKSLYIPFILCNIILIILHNFFLDINFYTDNPLFEKSEIGSRYGLKHYYSISIALLKTFYTLILATGSEQLVGATWFLKVLFLITVISCPCFFLIKKLTSNKNNFKITSATIYIFFIFIGFIVNSYNHKIGGLLSCFVIFYLGILYKKYEFKIKLNFLLSILCFIILLIFYTKNITTFGFNGEFYNKPFIASLAYVSGFFFTLYLSKLLEKIKFIQNVLSYIGKHTMIILCLHLLFFKIITYLQVLIYNQPDYMLAAFPTLFNQNGWWIAYTVVGIAGPLITLEVYKKLKQNINNKLQSLFH